MPWLFFKGRACELFGWTFRQFDEQPADEVLSYFHLRAVYNEIVAARRVND